MHKQQHVARIETRMPCPVCLGAMMHKARIGDGDLTVDHCTRCGGVWLEQGEVQQLRRLDANVFWQSVTSTPVQRGQCHLCHAFIDSRDVRCPACGEKQVLDCPKCVRPLESAVYEDVTLDVCRNCRGVWFDHAELSAIWRLELNRAITEHSTVTGLSPDAERRLILFDALAFDPFLTYYAASAAMHTAGAAGELMANAPEIVAGAAEVATEAATGVFEVLLEIIGGIFS